MITTEIVEYIKKQLLAGESQEKIRNDLLSNGWDGANIDEAMLSATSTNTPTTEQNAPAKSSKTILILILSIVLILLSGGVVFAFSYYKNFSTQNIDKEVVKSNDINTENTNSQITIATSTQSDDNLATSTILVATTSSSMALKSFPAITFSELVLNGNASLVIGANSQKGYTTYIGVNSSFNILAKWVGEGLRISLIGPNNKTIDLTSTPAIDASKKISGTTPNPIFIDDNGSFMLVYSSDITTAAGDWKLVVKNTSNKKIGFSVGIMGTANSVSVLGKSSVTIFPKPTAINAHIGEDIVLSVEVGEISVDQKIKLIPDLNIQAEIVDESTRQVVKKVNMTDDNINGYGLAHDGTYYAMYFSDLKPGNYEVFYTVTGQDLAGQKISFKSNPTYETSGLHVSSDNAQILGGVTDEGLDTTGSGKIGVIEAHFWVDSKKAGNYILVGTFVSPSGKEIPLSTNFSKGVEVSRVTLILNSAEHMSQMSNGVYKIKDISIFETTDRTLWVDSYVNDDGVYATKNYTVK